MGRCWLSPIFTLYGSSGYDVYICVCNNLTRSAHQLRRWRREKEKSAEAYRVGMNSSAAAAEYRNNSTRSTKSGREKRRSIHVDVRLLVNRSLIPSPYFLACFVFSRRVALVKIESGASRLVHALRLLLLLYCSSNLLTQYGPPLNNNKWNILSAKMLHSFILI